MKTIRHDENLSGAINNVLWSYNQGQYRYINDFVRLNKSGADMLLSGIFPNAKEITESYGALNAALRKLKLDPGNPDINVVFVGDGHTPRTATLFAFRTKWNCISLDPELRQDKIPLWESSIQHLKCIPKKVEEVDLNFENNVLIVAVHSHANMMAILDHIKSPVRSMIAIECCISYNHPNIEPKPVYRDSGIWAPKNLVKVWKAI